MIILTAACAIICLGMRAVAQPTACSEDSQCPTNFYCEESMHFCRECIKCHELNRQIPILSDGCVKSVIDCGACYAGLEEDLRLGGACVSPADKRSDDDRLSVPPWVIGVLVFFFLGLFFAVAIFITLKRSTIFTIFKIRTSAHASVPGRSQPSANGASTPAALSELGPPPPYNAVAPPAALHLPSSAPNIALINNGFDEESATLLIKRASDEAVEGPREASGRQAARPFSTPSQYVRPPARGYGLFEEEESSVPTHVIDHDESTMESRWTPNENNSVVEAHATDSGASAIVASESTTEHRQGSAGAVPQRPSEGAGSTTPPPRAFPFFGESHTPQQDAGAERTAAGPSFVINYFCSTTMEQSNNVNL